ncbi:MAG: DUF3604 domain-containing protein [Myxococcales bacterium]|nr:DUF3604 domain-containing protein [Myxococcales bacterium]
MPRSPAPAPALALALALAACQAEPAPWVEEREPCDDHNPLRNLYWGDLHVHTSYSFDAWLNDVRVDPALALRFAAGEAVKIPPLGVDGLGTQEVRLDRPLDFVSITDHSEYLAEVAGCTTPGSPVFEESRCQKYREAGASSLVAFGLGLDTESPSRFSDLCGDGGLDCPGLAGEVWTRVQEAAEAGYDRTRACSMTTFVGYEWSGSRDLANLHRNVIFRSSQVPPLPVSHFEAPTAHGLWTRLQAECREGIDGCDVMSIPHNANWSNGQLFYPEVPEGEDPVAVATLRAEMEPLLEVFQHKGDSECINGISGVLGAPDELCNFEKLRDPPYDDCGDGFGTQGMIGRGCISRLDYLRGILLEGLRQEEALGVNPYLLGVIASTDTHNGTPGMTAEAGFPGHFGSRDADPIGRLTGAIPAGVRDNAGGLVAVWAEEKSRGAIFDALRRREAYGTSGPRIAVRVFGGWELPEDLCDRADLVAVADAAGVPMGGVLPPAPTSAAGGPRIVVSALRDPGSEGAPGTPLQRAQVIKGWLDAGGEGHIEVFDVAGGDNGASVDLATCEPQGSGADALCGVWEDASFDPARPAFYYVRVVENPVCRWSTRDCMALAADERPEVCDDPAIPKVIQERAWTSPIWHRPGT